MHPRLDSTRLSNLIKTQERLQRKPLILVSACLVGFNCRYNARIKVHPNILRKLQNQPLLIVCPEVLGGLPTPRPPVRFVPKQSKPLTKNAGGEVIKGQTCLISTTGQDVTQYFINGAQKIMRLIKLLTIHCAYLKTRSPSCGSGMVASWDAQRNSSKLLPGNGILTTFLKTVNIKVLSV